MTSSLTALEFAPGALNTGMPRSLIFDDGNVVDAGTGAADGLEARGDVAAVHVGRAHEDGVGVLDVVADLIAIRRQALRARPWRCC